MNKLVIGIIIVCISLLTGCIKEDQSNCPQDFQHEIYFIYNADGNRDIFNSKIESVNLYIFNNQGEYMNNYTYNRNQLESYQGARLRLPKGIYTIVGWGNVTGLSEITENSDLLEDYFLFSAPYLQDEIIINFDSLYYGKQVVSISGEEKVADTVYFQSSHINMEIYVEGLESTLTTRAVNDPNGWIVVRNVYTGYDFNMNVTGDMATIYPDFLYDTTNRFGISQFNLFRFKNENSILIDIYNGEGESVYTLSLQEFLLTNDINVEGINEITVPIRIQFKGKYVHVSVAEWESENVKPII